MWTTKKENYKGVPDQAACLFPVRSRIISRCFQVLYWILAAHSDSKGGSLRFSLLPVVSDVFFSWTSGSPGGTLPQFPNLILMQLVCLKALLLISPFVAEITQKDAEEEKKVFSLGGTDWKPPQTRFMFIYRFNLSQCVCFFVSLWKLGAKLPGRRNQNN